VKAESQPSIAEFRGAAMKYLLDYFDGWARAAVKNPDEIMDYDGELLYGHAAIAEAAGDFAAFSEARHHLFHQWITSFDSSWPRTKDLWLQSGLRQSELMDDLLGTNEMPPNRWKDNAPEAFQNGLSDVADDLSHSSSSVMQIYGIIAKALADPGLAAATPQTRDVTIKAVFTQFEETIKNAKASPRLTRLYAYVAAADAIRMLPVGSRSRTEVAIDLLNFAIARKQLIPYTTIILLRPQLDVTPSEPSAQKITEVLERTLQLSQAKDTHMLDGNADGVRQMISSALRRFDATRPVPLADAATRPWESAKLLANLASLPGISRIWTSAQVVDDQVYFVGSGTDGEGKFFIQTFEIPLAGGTPKPLAKTVVDPMPVERSSDTDLDWAYRLIQGSAVDDKNYYACVHDQGVIVFPRNGAAAIRLDTTHGLPSNWARSVVAMNGNVYISISAHDGSYLVKWCPTDQTMDVRISTLRGEKKSALDNTPRLLFLFLIGDPANNRLILEASQGGSSHGWQSCRGGLWQIEAGDGSMKHLVTSDSGLDLGRFMGIDGDSLYVATTLWVVEYNLKTNKAKYVSFKTGSIKPNYIKDLDLNKETLRGTGWALPDNEQPGGRTVIDHWLWLGGPLRRVSADGQTTESLSTQLTPEGQPLDTVFTNSMSSPFEGRTEC
jgi:hypothetical protein